MERSDLVEKAANTPNADLADLLLHHIGRENGCSRTVTFDRAFSAFEGVERLQ